MMMVVVVIMVLMIVMMRKVMADDDGGGDDDDVDADDALVCVGVVLQSMMSVHLSSCVRVNSTECMCVHEIFLILLSFE